MNNNLIIFPKEKLRSAKNIQSQEELLKSIEEYKKSFATELSEILSEQVFGELARSGIDFENNIEELFPSMILITEAINSLQLKAAGVSHPLQDFAIDAFTEEENTVENYVDNDEKMDYDNIN